MSFLDNIINSILGIGTAVGGEAALEAARPEAPSNASNDPSPQANQADANYGQYITDYNSMLSGMAESQNAARDQWAAGMSGEDERRLEALKRARKQARRRVKKASDAYEPFVGLAQGLAARGAEQYEKGQTLAGQAQQQLMDSGALSQIGSAPTSTSQIKFKLPGDK